MFLRGLGSWWIALRISSLLILALVSTALEALWQRGYAQSAIVSSSPAPEKPDEKMLTPSPTVPMDPEVTTANSLAVCTKRLEQQSRLLRGSLNFTLRLADTLAECEQTSELTAPNCANKLLSCEASLGKVQMENTGLNSQVKQLQSQNQQLQSQTQLLQSLIQKLEQVPRCVYPDRQYWWHPIYNSIDCSPYKCKVDNSGCGTSCTNVNDCTAPNVCDQGGFCISPDSIPQPGDSGD
jgi:hypothetical protein